MRRLSSCTDPAFAERVTRYLAERGIATEVRTEPDVGTAVWVLDEDRLAAARKHLKDLDAAPMAEQAQINESKQVVTRTTEQVGRPPVAPGSPWRRLPVTLGLIAASLAVGAMTKLQEEPTEAGSVFSIAPYLGSDGEPWQPKDGLAAVRSGQVWRLVTPIFIHFGPAHLLFNMLWLWTLGGAIELRLGSVLLLLVVLTVAIASNLAEYWLNFGFDLGLKKGVVADIGVKPSPWFGGMSGVVFGLFGLIWMRARLVPGSGLAMPRDMVVWMLMWLLVCTTGLIGPVANVAHGVGLLTGMAAGAAPRLWRQA
jgi:GlpG protein